MVDFKINFDSFVRRLVGWLRDLILVFSMWSIWLVRDYMPDLATKNVVTGFLIAVIVITILIREYIVGLDNAIIGMELELEKIKRRG